VKGDEVPLYLRASPAVSPARPPGRLFFIRMDENGPVASPDPRFLPD
jgi:hypothetical protein